MQLLYSYLLVEKPFLLESLPTPPTKEKRFAYSLYLDFICLINRISRQVVGKHRQYPLAATRFVVITQNDEKIKSLLANAKDYPFTKIEALLAQQISDSLLFRGFEKDREEGISTDRFWELVFNNIIYLDPQVNDIIRNLPDYSLSGLERAKALMDETFRNFYTSNINIDDALRTLETSMQKARDLYMRLLALPVELTRLHFDNLEDNRRKLLATSADLNPNMKLINNIVPESIEKDVLFDEYVEKNHLSWRAEDTELLEILLKKILDSELYKKYRIDSEASPQKDVDFWKEVMLDIILNDQNFLEYLENKSVFWNDDLEIMASFVIKTFKKIENPETRSNSVMPMYKDGDDGKDSLFGGQLIKLVVRNKDIYKNYIEKALEKDKWSADRLAFMDVIIIMTALAEIINFPDIPLKVSLNEYIEIAKSYSTSKSGQFVNGLIATILPMLQDNKYVNSKILSI